MKRLLSIFFVLVFVLVRSLAQTRYCDKIDGEYIIEKQYLTISYNIDGKIPNYVGYYLTKQNLQGDIARDSKFYAEPTLLNSENLKASQSAAKPSDYTNSGYDRGHMSPAADWHFSKSAMHDSFSMANICPQAPQLNRIYWKNVETEEREDISQCDTLYIISGEITGEVSEGFSKFQKVSEGSSSTNSATKTIKNGVQVPTQFYKTIVGVRNHKVVLTKAWLFDNTNDKQPASTHTTTIQAIEQLIHQDLYHQFWFSK